MVKFQTKVDRNGRIYLPKPIRESGIDNIIEIAPNTSAAVIYKTGIKLQNVLASIKIIQADIEHRLEMNAQERTNKCKNGSSL